MNKQNLKLIKNIKEKLTDEIISFSFSFDMITLEVENNNLLNVAKKLKDDENFNFSQLMDVAGIDYYSYGNQEWETKDASFKGFSRGKKLNSLSKKIKKRFAVVYHLLSLKNNVRLRIRSFTTENDPPCIPSVSSVWNSADWFEREAFDLFGIFFIGHTDLRRILTDYGFIGHPFRKDFPLIGEMEIRYDDKQQKVIYDSVSITERTLVPRVIRKDNRYKN